MKVLLTYRVNVIKTQLFFDVQLWKNTTWEEKLEGLEKSKNKEIDILKENIKTKGEQMREMLVEQKKQLIVIKREVDILSKL